VCSYSNLFVSQAPSTDIFARYAQALALQLPLNSQFGLRKSAKKQDELDWKGEHMKFFNEAGLPWPPSSLDTASSQIHLDLSGLLPRQRELAWFLSHVFRPRWTVEFVDVQPSMMRLVAPCLNGENGGIRDDKTPWRNSPPVLTGTSRILVRHLVGDQVVQREVDANDSNEVGKMEFSTRMLECFESLRLMGWCDDAWKKHRNTKVTSPEQLELIMNIAGNAFSAWAYLPCEMALLATWGTFHPRFHPDKEVAGSPGDNNPAAEDADDKSAERSSSSSGSADS